MKYSIIVPVYNVELYLEECLNSILSQEFPDYEVICINDASTDRSYEILLKYAEKNRQIKVVSNSCNRGPSFSRNVGVDIAEGDYILFVDSDDMLCPNALNILNHTIEDKDVEMVCFRCSVKNEGKVAKEKNALQNEDIIFSDSIQTGQNWFKEMAHKNLFLIYPVAQLYKREFLQSTGLKFYEGILHEDLLYVFSCALAASKIIYIHEYIYIYRKRDNSITSTLNVARLDSLIIILGEVLAKWHTCKLEYGMDEAIFRYINDGLVPYINKMCAYFPEHHKMKIGKTADQFLYDMFRGRLGERFRYVHLNNLEIEQIRKYEKVVVFGAGAVGVELVTCLKSHNVGIDAIAVSDKSINVDKIFGISIYQIEELLDMRDSALFIIAIINRNQEAVFQVLERLGIKNIMRIDTER